MMSKRESPNSIKRSLCRKDTFLEGGGGGGGGPLRQIRKKANNCNGFPRVNCTIYNIYVPYDTIFLRIGDFCVLRELIFAIWTDWFFLLGINFCGFQKVPSIQH